MPLTQIKPTQISQMTPTGSSRGLSKRVALALAGLLLAAGAGCSQTGHTTAGADKTFTKATKYFVVNEVYRVEPPDEITIKAPMIKEIDGSKQEVRTDGKINLNLLGEVQVSGKSVAEINAELRELASRFYKNPDVKAEVVSKSKFYAVYGQGVATPGKKVFTGHDTVIKALAECGFSVTGWPDKVHLHRQVEGAPTETVLIDFKQVFLAGDMRQNYVLQEGDIIYVPNGPLAQFNIDLERIIGPVTGAGNVAGTASGVSTVGRP